MKKLIILLLLLLIPSLAFADGMVIGSGAAIECTAPASSPDVASESSTNSYSYLWDPGGQSFQFATAGKLYSISLRNAVINVTGTLQIRFGTSANLTDGNYVDSCTFIPSLTYEEWSTSGACVFPTHPNVTTGTTYYFAWDHGASAFNGSMFWTSSGNPYAGGSKYGNDTWDMTGSEDPVGDLTFRVYLCQ